MIHEIAVHTGAHACFVDITGRVSQWVRESGVQSGVCHIYVPHTTAGLTINENADPNVVDDLLMALDKHFPWRDGYRHYEGNSAAHLKASLMGFNQTVLVQEGRLLLGTWQGIYLAEFDGPRQRRVLVKLVPDPTP